MATYRTVYVSFWDDPKVDDDFTPEDKYFYLYLLTNPHANLCGCYEVSMKQMVSETGYNEDTVKRLLARMEKVHGVIRYDSSTKEVFIPNWHKYNWANSPKTISGAVSVAKGIKSIDFRKAMNEILIGYGYPMDTLYIPYAYPMDTSVTVSVTDTDTDTVTDTVSVISSNTLTSNTLTNKTNTSKHPTVEEVEEYCLSRGNTIDAQEFVDYYASQNWKKANGQPLVDWKAGIRQWEQKRRNEARGQMPRKEQEKMNALADLERRMKESEAREREERR